MLLWSCRYWKRAILIISGSFIASACLSQLPAEDSSLYHASLDQAIAFYHRFLFPEPELYDGTEYLVYDNQIARGSPYFQSTKFSPGYIVYNTMLYEHIPLMYDLVRGSVVIQSPGKAFFIELNKEAVTRFGILGHQFIRLNQDSAANELIHTVFYDLLYDGKIRLLKKQTKSIQEEHNGIQIEQYITEHTDFYIEKKGRFFLVNRKNSLFKILGDRKKEIKQYMRKNNLKLRKNKDDVLAKIGAYYDTITK